MLLDDKIEAILEDIDGTVSPMYQKSIAEKRKWDDHMRRAETDMDYQSKELFKLIRPLIRRALKNKTYELNFNKGYSLDHSCNPIGKKPYIEISVYISGMFITAKEWPKSAEHIRMMVDGIAEAANSYLAAMRRN